MKISNVIFSKGYTGFFFDDQLAIKQGAKSEGAMYFGKPVTDMFTSIRQAGESVSIMLVLDNGSIAVGDAAAVQYSGAGGRDSLFLAKTNIDFLNKHIKPLLLDRELTTFREDAAFFDNLEVEGKRLHTALRYGLGQVLLDAHALANNQIKSEVISSEYNLPIVSDLIPLFGQTGDDRYNIADKMIIKEVDVLPHALINNVDTKLGRKGEKLVEYIDWLVNRIKTSRTNQDYKPNLHIDVYGTIGALYEGNTDKVAEYIASLEKHAGGLPLYIEGPVDMTNRDEQVEAMKKVYDKLKSIGSSVKIVADEWCNTIEDIKEFTDEKCCDMVQIKTPDLGSVHNVVESVLYCQDKGMESYQGGTCNETDVSARTCVHLAMAARPERMLAKPGMGFDEGFSIVRNEMTRISNILKVKHNL